MDPEGNQVDGLRPDPGGPSAAHKRLTKNIRVPEVLRPVFRGAATNLPTPVATSAAGGGSSTYARTDEILNYEISNSEIHEIITPGSVKKISLSVLVDNVTDAAQMTTLKNAVTRRRRPRYRPR